MPANDHDTVSVSLLALHETTPAALYGLLEVFSSVGVAWTELTGQACGGTRIAARIIAPTAQMFAAALGAPIKPHATFAGARDSDIVIVTDLALAPDTDPRGRWPEAAAWLRRQFSSGAIVASVCTGSILLAEAGLLDGNEATTHWGAADIFARHYPRVRLRPARILVPAGPDHRIVTGGGASAWEDLALYLVARFCGKAEAVRTAKVFLLGDRSDGQLPYAALGRPRRHDDAAIEHCQRWIAGRYASAAPVTRMIAESGLTARTFKRRFRAATGYGPMDYVHAVRIEEAKQLLETTRDPIDVVAREIGYREPAYFRRLFRRRTGVTPARYRRRMQSLAHLRRR